MKKDWKYNLIIGLFLTFLLFPLLIIIVWSFTNQWPWPKLLPDNFGLRGWNYFWSSSSQSVSTLLFSVGLSATVTLITILITLPASKALALYEFKGKKVIDLLIFLPIIVPMVAVAMGIHIQFIQWGLANTVLGVIIIHIIPCIPYAVRILKSVYEIVGEQMELQARNLGASKWQTFIYVSLPMILPGVISAGSLVFIVSFSQYFLTFLIGGGQIITFTMISFPFIQSGDRMLASVYSVVFVTTTIICLFIVEKLTTKFYQLKVKEYRYV